MIAVTFTLDPANPGAVNIRVDNGPMPFGNGTMTLRQFRDAMPPPIRVAVRAAIDQTKTELDQAAANAAARAAANADQADADRLAAEAAAINEFTP